MIKDIKVLSRLQIQILGSNVNNNGSISFCFPFLHEKWHLISIHEGVPFLDDKIQEVFRSIGCCGFLSLHFWDIMAKHFDRLKKEYPDCVLFNRSHAQQIIGFIDEINKSRLSTTLVIHCHAGISRSGAVATFACDYLNLDYQQFTLDNYGIRANPYILHVLHDVANTKARYDGITIS